MTHSRHRLPQNSRGRSCKVYFRAEGSWPPCVRAVAHHIAGHFYHDMQRVSVFR